MMIALVSIFLLPVVFLGALSHSADAHPPSMRETLTTLAQPVRGAFDRAVAYCQHLQRH